MASSNILWQNIQDKNQDNKLESEEKFKNISAAYAILSDKDKKRTYDFESKNAFKNGHSDFGGFSERFDMKKGYKNFFNRRY